MRCQDALEGGKRDGFVPTKTHLIIGLVMLKRPLGSLTFTEWQQLSHLSTEHGVYTQLCRTKCHRSATAHIRPAKLEATLGIEPSDIITSSQVKGIKYSRCAPNVHQMCTASNNQRRSEAFFMAFCIVNPNRSEASRSAVGIMCV